MGLIGRLGLDGYQTRDHTPMNFGRNNGGGSANESVIDFKPIMLIS
jgi:hypothetical protein